jgi:hypothetical protein
MFLIPNLSIRISQTQLEPNYECTKIILYLPQYLINVNKCCTFIRYLESLNCNESAKKCSKKVNTCLNHFYSIYTICRLEHYVILISFFMIIIIILSADKKPIILFKLFENHTINSKQYLNN